jgi:uncharacterized protein YqhQ
MAKYYYGGQAVVEGVMMRGRHSVAVAVRKPEGDISLYEEKLSARLYQNALFRLPFFRGVLMLWEMLGLGSRMMTLSANVAAGADDPAPALSDVTPAIVVSQEAADTRKSQVTVMQIQESPQTGKATFVLTLVVSLAFAVAIFFVGPLLLTSVLHRQIGDGWLSLIIEGVIRLALLLGYLKLIGQVPDIQRVFGYHGAEHKAINAMEHGEPLDVEHVRQASRVHTRCGTGFLLLVMVVSIVVFALVGSPTLLLKIVSRILLVPVVAAIAYELMRLGAANYRFRIVRWLLAPGLALQGLTTREPDAGMMECAIVALECVMARDRESDGMPGTSVSTPISSPLVTSLE